MSDPGNYVEPLRAYHFKVEVKDLAVAHFMSCSGIEARVESIPYRAGGEGQVVHQLPSVVDYSPCLLRWGLTESVELWNWMTESMAGTVTRREVSVMFLAPDGVTEQQRYNLFDAWPCEWRAAELDSMTREVAIETLALRYERVERA